MDLPKIKHTYKLVKLNGREFLYEKTEGGLRPDDVRESLHTPFSFANEWLTYAAISEGEIHRFKDTIGRFEDLEIIREVEDPKKEFAHLELKKEDAELTDWIGKTIKKVEDLAERESGFWGDEVKTFLFEFEDGSVYIGSTYGGNTLGGFPGSMYHGFSVEKILNPEVLKEVV